MRRKSFNSFSVYIFILKHGNTINLSICMPICLYLGGIGRIFIESNNNNKKRNSIISFFPKFVAQWVRGFITNLQVMSWNIDGDCCVYKFTIYHFHHKSADDSILNIVTIIHLIKVSHLRFVCFVF